MSKEWSTDSSQTRTVKLPQFIWNAINDIAKRRGFLSASEFIRYALRKEIDFQLGIIYTPQLKRTELD